MKTIKARYSKGLIEPLEKLPFSEGIELTITIHSPVTELKGNTFSKAAGGWKGTIDATKLIDDIYEDRLVPGREVPKLK